MPYDKEYNLSDTINRPGLTEPCDMTFAYPAHFRLLIEGTKFEKVQYGVRSTSIPEISVSGAPMPTRANRDLEMSPDTINYSPLDIQFLIDERFENYVLIHDWIYGLVKEVDEDIKKRQLTLMLLSAQFNTIKEFTFVDAYPTSLSSVEYTYEEQDPSPLAASVSFNYSYFTVK